MEREFEQETSHRQSRYQQTVIKTRYEKSLSRSGFPSNAHVYDLDCVYLQTRLPRREAKYLLKMSRFFYSLTYMEGLIFLNDYLERGKNYRYWWMKYGDEKFIRRERRRFRCNLLGKFDYLIGRK